jgi:DNA-binding MarR family transcriptional regulator
MTETKLVESECIASSMRKLNRIVTAIYDGALAETGLKASQFTVLVAVANRAKAKPSELTKLLHMDESTLSRNVERICARGWLRFEADHDGRSHFIRVTDEGQALIGKCLPAWQHAQANVTRRLGAENIAALRSALRKLTSISRNIKSQVRRVSTRRNPDSESKPKVKAERDQLSGKQLKFVIEYLRDYNGTKAAVRAGYSPKGAAVRASCLLKNIKISARIRAAQNAALHRNDVSVDRIIRQYASIGFLDAGRLFDEHGRLLPISEMPEEVRCALDRFQLDESRVYVQFADKLRALESLAKIGGWLNQPLVAEQLAAIRRLLNEDEREQSEKAATAELALQPGSRDGLNGKAGHS